MQKSLPSYALDYVSTKMDSVGVVPDDNKRKQCAEFHKDYKRTCRLNRMIIKTTSSCFMVMWGSNDDVDLVVDAAAHKTAAEGLDHAQVEQHRLGQ